MFQKERVFSPLVAFKDGGGEGGGQGGAGGSAGGGEGGAGDGQDKNTGGGGSGDKSSQEHQEYFDKGFNLGFGKGAEKAERQWQEKHKTLLKGLGIDTEKDDVEDQLKALQETVKKSKDGGKDRKDKSGENDAMVQQLRSELTKANKTIDELKASHEAEIRKVLIDQTLLNLAGAAGLAKSVTPNAVAVLFKQDYVLDLDKERKVTVTQMNGAPIVDPKTGNTKTLEAVFTDWIGQNSYLLAATNRGGAGGQENKEQGAGGAGEGGKYTAEQLEEMDMAEFEKLSKEGKIK